MYFSNLFLAYIFLQYFTIVCIVVLFLCIVFLSLTLFLVIIIMSCQCKYMYNLQNYYSRYYLHKIYLIKIYIFNNTNLCLFLVSTIISFSIIVPWLFPMRKQYFFRLGIWFWRNSFTFVDFGIVIKSKNYKILKLKTWRVAILKQIENFSRIKRIYEQLFIV